MTILQKLQNANLPVISADENGQISMGYMTEDQSRIFNDILTEHFQPAVWAEVLESRSNSNDMQTEYQNAVSALTQIIDTPSMTNAQAVQAIKTIARVLRITIKVVRRLL